MSLESVRDAEVKKLNDAQWVGLEYSRDFTDKDFALLKSGFISKDMDTKWSFYFKDGEYILERSWIKTPVYKIIIEDNKAVKAFTKFQKDNDTWNSDNVTIINSALDWLFENVTDLKIESISKQFIYWYHACVAGADVSLLATPRSHIGAILFLIGGIDYLCQSLDIDDELFSEICLLNLNIVGFEEEVVKHVLIDFFGKQQQDNFSLNACNNGGNRLKDFLAGNSLAALSYGAWIEEWAKNPDLPKSGQNV